MNHKNLDLHKLSIDFTIKIYQLTESFPKREQYSLTDQIRRCAVSIPSNIAEGAARGSDKEFIRFLYISLGSVSELETQLIIARKLNYFSNLLEYTEILERIKSMILGMINYLSRKA